MFGQSLLSNSQGTEKQENSDQRTTRSQTNLRTDMQEDLTPSTGLVLPANLTSVDRGTNDSPRQPRKSKDSPGSAQLLGDILKELKLLREEVKDLKSRDQCSCQGGRKQCDSETTSSKQIDITVTRLIDGQKKMWTDLLNRRKTSYYNQLKNAEKAEVYEQYLTREPPFIPKICREKDVAGQTSEEWLELKKKRELDNTRHNIDKMKTFAKHHEKSTKELDDLIKLKFENQSEEIKEKVFQVWHSEVVVEENVSKDLWKKNKKFLEELPLKEEQMTSENNVQHEDVISDQGNQWTTVQRKKTPRSTQISPRYQQKSDARGNTSRVDSGRDTATPSVNSQGNKNQNLKNNQRKRVESSRNFRQKRQNNSQT